MNDFKIIELTFSFTVSMHETIEIISGFVHLNEFCSVHCLQ